MLVSSKTYLAMKTSSSQVIELVTIESLFSKLITKVLLLSFIEKLVVEKVAAIDASMSVHLDARSAFLT